MERFKINCSEEDECKKSRGKYNKEVNYKELRRKVSSLIGKIIKTREVDQQIKAKLDKINPDEDILLEEAVNSLYQFDRKFDDVEHISHLKRCLDGKEDFHCDFFVKKYHSEYSKVIRQLSKLVKKRDARIIQTLRRELSAQKPIELLILDALRFIEFNGNTGAEVDVEKSPLKEKEVFSDYVQKLIEVLKGDRAYRLFAVCSKNGLTYSNIRIL